MSAPIARSGANEGATVSCAPGERRLYMIVFGRAAHGIQLYCADRMIPVGLIPFGEHQAPEQIDHDRLGNLFVMWENLKRSDQSGLSILDSSGKLLAERAEPYGMMLVERKRSVAYLLYTRRRADTTETLAGHAVRFAQFETFYRSVGGNEKAELALPDVSLRDAAIDALGRIVINRYRGNRGRSGFSAILDPKKGIIDSVYAPACAMAAGGDGLLYAVNCIGELRVFDPVNYRLLGDRKLNVGGPYLGNANYPGHIAIDGKGTAFVANGSLDTLLRFERGAMKPSAIARNVPHVADLQLDAAGNVYALEGGPSAVKSSIRVFHGHTLEQVRTYDFAHKTLSVYGMTIVDP